MVLIDSSVWIDYFNGVANPFTEHFDSLLGNSEVLLADLVVAEVLQGFKSDSDYDTALNLFKLFDCGYILNFEIAVKSAQNYRALREKGITVRKTIDCIMATYCIENDVSLLSSDKDFMPFKTHLNLDLLDV